MDHRQAKHVWSLGSRDLDSQLGSGFTGVAMMNAAVALVVLEKMVAERLLPDMKERARAATEFLKQSQSE